MKTILDRYAQEWKKLHPTQGVVISYAASSALAKQIEQGAPADIFISADREWVFDLQNKGLLRSDEILLASNELVLITQANAPFMFDTFNIQDLPLHLGQERLAVAQVQTVPAGKYARNALNFYHLWPQLEARLAQTDNVRAALRLVAYGEAPFGIVYHSDAFAEPRVKIVMVFATESHPPILYSGGVVKSSSHGDAALFLRGLKASALFKAHGFTPLGASPP